MFICDGFEGAMVHRGTNSLRLIGEAGTPCLRKRNDVCSLQKGSSPVLCKNQNVCWIPNTCRPMQTDWAEVVDFVSSPSHWVSIGSGIQAASGSTGMLVQLLFLTVPIKDRTEQEGAQAVRG